VVVGERVLFGGVLELTHDGGALFETRIVLEQAGVNVVELGEVEAAREAVGVRPGLARLVRKRPVALGVLVMRVNVVERGEFEVGAEVLLELVLPDDPKRVPVRHQSCRLCGLDALLAAVVAQTDSKGVDHKDEEVLLGP
jgi:hypothetical protein